MKREYIWIPKASSKKGERALASPIKWPKNKVKPTRLWTLMHFMNKDVRPPTNLPLEHVVTAVLEDIMHDWNFHLDHLIYRGSYAEGGCWIALEYD